MSNWGDKHRAFAVEHYFKNIFSIKVTLQLFRKHFNIHRNKPLPSRPNIYRWIECFRESSSAKKRAPPGRPRSIRSHENIQAVKDSVARSPSRSAKKHSSALRLSDRSVRRILHLDLKFKPFKTQVVQELGNQDMKNRMDCERILEMIKENPDAIIITSDEAHFYLSGGVNKQNCRYWSSENPHNLHQKPLRSKKVTVWSAVGDCGIWGPYFFEEGNETVTVNAERYTKMLNEFVRPNLLNLETEEVFFLQDGATSHTARQSMDVLRERFPGRLISLRGDVPWPARSPDIAPCDFFLWGYLKSNVFQERPSTIEDLKEVIIRKVQEIPPDMTHRVMQNFRKRVQLCVASRGGHLKDVIF